MEPVNVGMKWSEIIKFTEKQCMWKLIERFAKIEMNGIDLTLGMNHRSNEVKMSNSTCICRCRFRMGESLLDGVWKVLM
jgi:hypothetical protein